MLSEVTGKLTGMSLRVPTIDASVVDLTIELETPAAHTLYISSGVILDYAIELNALGYIVEVRPSGFCHLLGFTLPKTETLLCAEELFGGILAAIENLDSI